MVLDRAGEKIDSITEGKMIDFWKVGTLCSCVLFLDIPSRAYLGQEVFIGQYILSPNKKPANLDSCAAHTEKTE